MESVLLFSRLLGGIIGIIIVLTPVYLFYHVTRNAIRKELRDQEAKDFTIKPILVLGVLLGMFTVFSTPSIEGPEGTSTVEAYEGEHFTYTPPETFQKSDSLGDATYLSGNKGIIFTTRETVFNQSYYNTHAVLEDAISAADGRVLNYTREEVYTINNREFHNIWYKKSVAGRVAYYISYSTLKENGTEIAVDFFSTEEYPEVLASREIREISFK